MTEKNGTKQSESSSCPRLSQSGTSCCLHFFVCVNRCFHFADVSLGLFDSKFRRTGRPGRTFYGTGSGTGPPGRIVLKGLHE